MTLSFAFLFSRSELMLPSDALLAIKQSRDYEAIHFRPRARDLIQCYHTCFDYPRRGAGGHDNKSARTRLSAGI